MVLVGIYSDVDGVPTNLMAVSEETHVSSAAGWTEIGLIVTPYVQEGASIWVALVSEYDVAGCALSAGTPGFYTATFGEDTWDDGMPSTFGAGVQYDFIYSIYVSYLPAEILSVAGLTIDSDGTKGLSTSCAITIDPCVCSVTAIFHDYVKAIRTVSSLMRRQVTVKSLTRKVFTVTSRKC